MLVLEVAFDAFGAELAFVDGEVFAGFEADDFVFFYFESYAALDAAEAAVGVYEFVGFAGVPAAFGLVVEMRAELVDESLF